MIAKRIIPLFLLKEGRLVKGTNFRDFTDVGDPVSQGMIYDAQGADEVAVVDIDASSQRRIIDTRIIEQMITKCRLPIAAGGGIRNIVDARKCFAAGADKIIVNTHAILNPSLVKELSGEFGAQSVTVSVDVRKEKNFGYSVYVYSGTKKVCRPLEDVLVQLIRNGAGEVMLTSMNREGTLSGFDDALYVRVRQLIPVPLIASGGAGCYDDIVRLFKKTDVDACGIGKMLCLRDYDIVRIKSYLKGRKVFVRDA